MNKLLISESPLVLQPKVAKILGLNEAIFMQQIHYWLQRSTHEINGLKWVYNSYDALQKQFPFWSVRTIKSVVKGLQRRELLFIGHFHKNRWDKTNWYSINYEKLGSTIECEKSVIFEDTKNVIIESEKVAPSLMKIKDRDYFTKTTTEITTEKKEKKEKNSAFKLLSFSLM